MILIFDADGLIKLNHAGVLGQVVRNYESLVPAAVHNEVVVRGASIGYGDPTEIGLILDESAVVVTSDIRNAQPESDPILSGLGAGQTQTLYLALQHRDNAVIVSDDRRFLGVLPDLALRFLVPSHIILGLARDEILPASDAKAAIDALRPFIRQSDFLEALEILGE
jgi:hypothetical protein